MRVDGGDSNFWEFEIVLMSGGGVKVNLRGCKIVVMGKYGGIKVISMIREVIGKDSTLAGRGTFWKLVLSQFLFLTGRD